MYFIRDWPILLQSCLFLIFHQNIDCSCISITLSLTETELQITTCSIFLMSQTLPKVVILLYMEDYQLLQLLEEAERCFFSCSSKQFWDWGGNGDSWVLSQLLNSGLQVKCCWATGEQSQQQTSELTRGEGWVSYLEYHSANGQMLASSDCQIFSGWFAFSLIILWLVECPYQVKIFTSLKHALNTCNTNNIPISLSSILYLVLINRLN